LSKENKAPGKELIARQSNLQLAVRTPVHKAKLPAIPFDLLESELFGP